jgi:hypothetical protein
MDMVGLGKTTKPQELLGKCTLIDLRVRSSAKSEYTVQSREQWFAASVPASPDVVYTNIQDAGTV